MGDLTEKQDSTGRGLSKAGDKYSDLPRKGTTVREKIKILFLSDDSPRQIALGMAIGVFLACSPFIGIHTVAAVALAFVLRASRLAALIGTLINNPFTMAFFYFFEFELGSDWSPPRLPISSSSGWPSTSSGGVRQRRPRDGDADDPEGAWDLPLQGEGTAFPGQ
jgi:hypothetical protein